MTTSRFDPMKAAVERVQITGEDIDEVFDEIQAAYSEPCNRMVVAGHGYRIPCANVRPCPLHDREQDRLSFADFEAFTRMWKPWAARCSTADAGVPAFPPSAKEAGAPASPMPRLFEEDA